MPAAESRSRRPVSARCAEGADHHRRAREPRAHEPDQFDELGKAKPKTAAAKLVVSARVDPHAARFRVEKVGRRPAACSSFRPCPDRAKDLETNLALSGYGGPRARRCLSPGPERVAFPPPPSPAPDDPGLFASGSSHVLVFFQESSFPISSSDGTPTSSAGAGVCV